VAGDPSSILITQHRDTQTIPHSANTSSTVSWYAYHQATLPSEITYVRSIAPGRVPLSDSLWSSVSVVVTNLALVKQLVYSSYRLLQALAKRPTGYLLCCRVEPAIACV
jgi:hypothetical protein